MWEAVGREGVDMWLWTIAIHPRLHTSISDIEGRWSFAQVVDAHVVMEALADVDALREMREKEAAHG